MQTIWIVLMMLTVNITRVVNLTESARFNLAFSDVLVPILGLLLLLKLRKFKFGSVFRHYLFLGGLLLWIVATGALAIYTPSIEDAGWIGLAKELIKTVIVVFYFWVGYNTLRMIRLDLWQGSWVVSTLIFIFGGFYIFSMAKQGTFLMGEEGKYLVYYMGTDTDPNHAASYLSLSFFAMGAFAWMTHRKWLKPIFYGTMALSIMALFITGSRGGMLGMALGLVVLVGGMFYKNWRFALAIVLTVLLLFFAAIIVDYTWFETHFAARVINKFVNFDAGLEIRTGLGQTAFMMGRDHFIFGVGRGNYVLNSPPYFEAIGQAFIDNIPHNTYTGLLAEVGLVGLMLFLTPVLAILYALWDRRKKNLKWVKERSVLWIWFFGGLTALAVQSSVLNVENRRFLWYVAGVLLYYIETDQSETLTLAADQVKKRLVWVNTLLVASVVVIGAQVFKDASIPAPRLVMRESQSYELPYFESNPGDEVAFSYGLSLGQNTQKKPRLMVSIYEVDHTGREVVLDRYEYVGASGTIKRTFYPSRKNASFYVRFTRLDPQLKSFVVMPKTLWHEDRGKSLESWYYFQIKPFERLTNTWRWADKSHLTEQTDFTQAIGQTFGSVLKVEAVSVGTSERGYPVVNVDFLVLEDFDRDYAFWAYGYPDNLHLMHENRMPSGLEGYGLLEPIVTSEWRKGETRTLKYEIPHKTGAIRLTCGFYTKIEGDVVRLYLEDGKTHALQLGWLNVETGLYPKMD